MNNNTLPSVRDIQRKKDINSNKAKIAHDIFNSSRSFAISKDGLSLRITRHHPYYQQLQAVINDIAAHHWGMVLHATAYLEGQPIPEHILPLL